MKISSESVAAATTMLPLTVDMMAESMAAMKSPPVTGERTFCMSRGMTASGLGMVAGSSTRRAIMPVGTSVQARIAEKKVQITRAVRAVRTSRMLKMATLCCGRARPTRPVITTMITICVTGIFPPPVMSRRFGSMAARLKFSSGMKFQCRPPKATVAVATMMTMEPMIMRTPCRQSVHTEARYPPRMQ